MGDTLVGYTATPLWAAGLAALTPAQRTNAVNRHDAEVRYLDEELGKFLDYIQPIYRKRIIIVSSDHGESLHDCQDWGDGTSLFDEQIRIPLIFADTDGRLGRPRREPVLVSNVDVLPTLALAVGAPVPPGLDGVAIQSTLADWSRMSPLTKRRVVVSEVMQSSTVADYARLAPAHDALREFRTKPINVLVRASIDYSDGICGLRLYKYIRNESREGTSLLLKFPGIVFNPHFHELYRLHQDPMELKSEMDSGLAVRIQNKSPLSGNFPDASLRATPLSKEQIERLRALGYIKRPVPEA